MRLTLRFVTSCVALAAMLSGALPVMATGSPAVLRPHLAGGRSPVSSWHWQNPLPHGNSLSSIACLGARTCYAVGSGTVMVSHDGGRTWSSTFDPAGGTLVA